MATAVGPVRLGFPAADAETVHEEMLKLRDMLVSVGLMEMQTSASYDTSEESDSSGVPTETNGRSKYMYFAFTDSLQGVAPVFLGVRISYAKYFNTHATVGLDRYVMELMVTRVMDGDFPSDAGALFSYPPGGYSANNSSPNGPRAASVPIVSKGDYAKYDGSTLFLAFGVDSNRVGTASNSEGVARCSAFALLSRVGMNVLAVLDTRGWTDSENQSVAPYLFTSPFANTRTNMSDGYVRAGHFKFDGGRPVVAPIYGLDEHGSPTPIQGVYTIPQGVALPLESTQLIRLDFSGEELDYMYFDASTLRPGSSDLGWLVEWR